MQVTHQLVVKRFGRRDVISVTLTEDDLLPCEIVSGLEDLSVLFLDLRARKQIAIAASHLNALHRNSKKNKAKTTETVREIDQMYQALLKLGKPK